MIIAKEFPDKQFETKEDLYSALRENKNTLIAQKKMITKEADSVIHFASVENSKGEVVKSENIFTVELNNIKAELVINTTNLLDSHSDVHIKGIWNKSVKEAKNILLLQEHQMKFNSIISDKVKANVKLFNWKDLGYNFEGQTEALVFESEISKDRNNFMFEQYAKGYVKEHSVGMRYVKIELAINSDNKYDVEEKAVYDKYIDQIANKKEAENKGYFWAVLEAKIIEGSAVVKGSNYATPTISVEAVNHTSTESIEPLINNTQKAKKVFIN